MTVAPMQTVEFDAGVFARLGGGVPARRQKLALSFLAALDSGLAELTAAMDAPNAAEARRIAHKIKSGARWVGANRLGACAEALECAPAGSDESVILTEHLAELLLAAAAARQRIDAELAVQSLANP